MTRAVRNRLGAGLTALAMVFAQVLLPVSTAFADSSAESLSGTLQPVWCHKTGQGWIAVLGNLNSDNNNRYPLMQLPSPSIEGLTLGVNGQVYSHDRSNQDLRALNPACVPKVVSAAIVITTSPNCGPNNDTITYPVTEGVVFSSATFTNNIATVIATLKSGYVWSDGTNTPKSYEVVDGNSLCLQVLPVPAIPTVTDACGLANAVWNKPANTEYITWSLTAGGRLAATAATGYVFEGNITTKDFGTAPDSSTLCPKPTVCTTVEPIHSTNLTKNGWTLPDDAEYVDGGIKLNVSGEWDTTYISRSMVGPLADIGNRVAFTASPSQYIGIHITTDKGILTYEYAPGYDGKWWSESDFGVASGMGYKTFDTLENIVAANPGVKTSLLRVLYTHPNKSSSVVTSVTVGCAKYTFDKEITQVKVCPAGDLPVIRSTDKNANGWTLKGSADYIEMDGGIKLNVPGNWVSSRISRDMVGPLADIGNQVKFTASPSQYVGIHVITDKGTLTYEYGPGYGGNWWSNSDFGVASGMGYKTFDTLDNIVAANPDVKTSKVYVLYTHPEKSSSVIKSVTVGCTEYVFSKAGGSGGIDNPTTPPTPTVPVVPSVTTPVVPAAGKGALLPEELPLTGENGSFMFTWIALLAAILTYGSVYYLQPKKRFEQ